MQIRISGMAPSLAVTSSLVVTSQDVVHRVRDDAVRGWGVGRGRWDEGNEAVRGTWYVVRGGQFESSALCAMAHCGVPTDHWPQATCLFSNPHPSPPRRGGRLVRCKPQPRASRHRHRHHVPRTTNYVPSTQRADTRVRPYDEMMRHEPQAPSHRPEAVISSFQPSEPRLAGLVQTGSVSVARTCRKRQW